MKITLTPKLLADAPKDFVRVRLVEDKSVRQLVREDGVVYIELGTGPGAEMSRRKFIILCRAIANAAKSFKAKKIAIQFDATPELFSTFPKLNISVAESSQLAAEAFEMANFEFNNFKTKPKEGWNVVEEILVCNSADKAGIAAAKRGQLIGQEVNACRVLSNTPAGNMTPRLLAKAAKDAVKGIDTVTVKTIGRAQIEALGMGLLAGVGAGSAEEPTFTVMEYKGAPATMKPIVIAGKGITFDSGGLNIKPSNSIYEMHMDMSGGAAVISAVALAAKLKVKKNVIGLIPAAENMLGQNATRPGDILKSLSGKTVEVTDTDAEGRLVLADALTYAKRFKPSLVIDVATLTGAAMVALGFQATGLMTRDDELSEKLIALGETSGDYLWRLPLWDEYEPIVKSDFADLSNHSISQGRYAGATNGAIFLWQFAKELDCPWAHLDIAPTMVSTTGQELAKGATGVPVRLLIECIEAWNPN
jgi:leucyl aminopeptidase